MFTSLSINARGFVLGVVHILVSLIVKFTNVFAIVFVVQKIYLSDCLIVNTYLPQGSDNTTASLHF